MYICVYIYTRIYTCRVYIYIFIEIQFQLITIATIVTKSHQTTKNTTYIYIDIYIRTYVYTYIYITYIYIHVFPISQFQHNQYPFHIQNNIKNQEFEIKVSYNNSTNKLINGFHRSITTTHKYDVVHMESLIELKT